MKPKTLDLLMARIHYERTYLRNGVLASLAGTVVFGILMQMMGMMPMVAKLTGNSSVLVGWINHLVIGTLFGVVLGLLLANLQLPRLVVGIAWGMVAWVGGALIVMPLWLGMPQMVLNLTTATPWWSLLGHLMYGMVAGLVAWGMETDPARRGFLTQGRARAA